MKKANPALIGLFILGALGIAIAALVFFGSAEILKERFTFVTLFDQDVDGLQIGSKVKLKGIPVGEVKKVLIRFESKSGEPATKPSIPVIFDMDVDKLSEHLGLEIDVTDPDLYQRHIEQGLRARLEMQSILTGLLQVNLDYVDDAAPENARSHFEHNGKPYPIIPAVKSDIQEAKQDVITAIANFSDTDFKGIADRLSTLIETLTAKFEELKPAEINDAVVAMRDRIESQEIDEMLKSFSDAGAKFSAVAEKVDKQVGDEEIAAILKSTESAMAAAEAAIETGETAARSIGKASENLESMTERDATFRKELETSIKDIGDAARRVSELAAYLSEHPNSVIFGKKDDTDDPVTRDQPRKFPGAGGKKR